MGLMWTLVGLLGAWGWIHRLVDKGLGHGHNWMVSRSKGEYHNGVMKAANWASYVMIGWHVEWLSVKRNSHAGDVDYIPSAEDDSEDDDQQVGGSVVASKKQKRPQYITPMSMNKVANLKKIRHMVTPNVSQKVSST
ncbi:hypothetical protein R6Q57_008849 [Mikania cordata]